MRTILGCEAYAGYCQAVIPSFTRRRNSFSMR